MPKIGVETDQHVQLMYKPAGLTERILAYVIDGIVLGAYWLFLISIASLNDGQMVAEINTEEFAWAGILIILLPIMLYHLIIEILWNGYSVGKWLMGIRVVKLDGTRPGISNYLLRWLLRLFEITLTSGGVALITILVNGKGQRLGDIAAKTCVIKVKRTTRLSDTVLEEPDGKYEAHFPQAMELNERDISVVNEVLKSKDKYERVTWINMVVKIRVHIQEKMGLSKTNMGDIQFLKQVVKDYNTIHGVLK